jgi:hypothetical protein
MRSVIRVVDTAVLAVIVRSAVAQILPNGVSVAVTSIDPHSRNISPTISLAAQKFRGKPGLPGLT